MPTTELTAGGQIVVPMSSLLDALSATMTEPERLALYEDLLDLRPVGVAPGDLIEAGLFNQMISDINALMLRVARLESGFGGPYIERIDPPGSEHATGSKIIIVGRNFKPSNADTKVVFGTVEVFDFFPESTDTAIVMPVPVGFAGLPIDLKVHVSTAGMVSNELATRITAPVIAANGTLDVRNISAALGTINIGQTYTLQWRIISQINLPRTILLEEKVSAVTGSSEGVWLDAITLSDPGPFELASGASKDITMTVKIPPGADAASINLLARTTEGNFTDLGTPVPLKVGQAPAVSDPRALVSMAAMVAMPELRQGSITVEGQVLQGFKMQPSKTLDLAHQVAVGGSGEGFYSFEATVEPGTDSNGLQTGRWTVGAMPAARVNIPGNQTQPFTVPLTSSATADVATVSWLVVTAKRFAAASGGSPTFTSFARIPIIGKA